MEIKDKARQGVKWTAISALITTILQLMLIAVLSRKLDKRDFGLVALATFVIGFSQLFIDMGISNAIIHRKDVSHRQLSSFYWLNIFIGVLLFSILIVISPFISRFYSEPDLIGVINWVAVTFLILPFGSQYEVLLRRDLQFRSLAIRNITSKLIGFIAGWILCTNNFGVYSLVFSNLISLFIGNLMLISIGIRFHRPSFHFSIKDIQVFLSFGMFQMGEKAMNYFNSQIDSIIIGKTFGVDVLGTYNIAKNLVMRPAQIINPIITKVSFPIMAKFQTDSDALIRIYLKALKIMSSVNFPIFMFMIFYAKPIVLIMFGERWLDSTGILRILSAYSLIRSTTNPVGSLQMAKGRADIGFYWNAILLLFIPVAIFIGSRWGIYGVCYAFLILQILLFFPVWKYTVTNLVEVKIGKYLGAFLVPLFSALVSNGVCYLIYMFLPIGVLPLDLSLHVGLVSIFYFLLMNWFSKDVILEFAKVFKIAH